MRTYVLYVLVTCVVLLLALSLSLVYVPHMFEKLLLEKLVPFILGYHGFQSEKKKEFVASSPSSIRAQSLKQTQHTHTNTQRRRQSNFLLLRTDVAAKLHFVVVKKRRERASKEAKSAFALANLLTHMRC